MQRRGERSAAAAAAATAAAVRRYLCGVALVLRVELFRRLVPRLRKCAHVARVTHSWRGGENDSRKGAEGSRTSCSGVAGF